MRLFWFGLEEKALTTSCDWTIGDRFQRCCRIWKHCFTICVRLCWIGRCALMWELLTNQLADCNIERCHELCENGCLFLCYWLVIVSVLQIDRLTAWNSGHVSLFHKPTIIDDETTLAKSFCSFGVTHQHARCCDCRRSSGTHRATGYR